MLMMAVTAQPARICCMGLRRRPGKVVSLSAIRSSRHFEGANINGVLFRAVPAYTDSDRKFEALIPTLHSPSKMLKVRPSQGDSSNDLGLKGGPDRIAPRRLPSFPASGAFLLTFGLEAPFTAVSRYRLMLDGGLKNATK